MHAVLKSCHLAGPTQTHLTGSWSAAEPAAVFRHVTSSSGMCRCLHLLSHQPHQLPRQLSAGSCTDSILLAFSDLSC